MKILIGMFLGLALAALGLWGYLATGSFNVAATVPASKAEKDLAAFALDRSVAKRAPTSENPVPVTPESLRDGRDHYREMCVTCHGAPGVDASEAGEGLNPPAPDLTLQKIQRRTDGELFWLTQNGIRMTGMPAFGPTHSDEEIWKIVAFLRRLPELSDEDQKALKGEPAAAPAAPAGAGERRH
jgi:mono/diheme cytochrome c family protein